MHKFPMYQDIHKLRVDQEIKTNFVYTDMIVVGNDRPSLFMIQ